MTTRAEEIAGEGPYKVERKDSQMGTLWDIVGPTSTDKWYGSEGEAQRECKHLDAAYKQGQQDRWIAVRELVIGWRYVVQEAGGYAFVGTYTGGRFEFTVDGNNYVRQVAKSQHITLLPSPPNPEQR